MNRIHVRLLSLARVGASPSGCGLHLHQVQDAVSQPSSLQGHQLHSHTLAGSSSRSIRHGTCPGLGPASQIWQRGGPFGGMPLLAQVQGAREYASTSDSLLHKVSQGNSTQAGESNYSCGICCSLLLPMGSAHRRSRVCSNKFVHFIFH